MRPKHPTSAVGSRVPLTEVRGRPRRTTAMKKHNHSSDDPPIQYRGKYSRHSPGQALTKSASDHNTGAKCLKPSKLRTKALSPAPSSLVCLFLRLTPAAFTPCIRTVPTAGPS